ncbi:ATP-binding protein [Bacillus horti]|uniref:hybrid sensor histidine kinase/response regulator n=1 Tax=Caldalkalibacillus horti TaxID=77523 RepID=UPI0031D54EDE
MLGLRWAWFTYFYTPEHPSVQQGVLDLRGWALEGTSSITLNGDWEFYPYAFLYHEDFNNQTTDHRPHYIQVPGDWREGFEGEKNASFGYGTYRIRILVDQPLSLRYAFWLQGIQASSVVEINGNEEMPFGIPAERAEDYTPRIASYLAYHKNEDIQEIELLIRVANFDNPINGGILRTIKFGSEAAIDNERMYSIGFQLVTFVILLLHALYAFILYLFNTKEKSFLLFCILLFLASITIVSDHDTLLTFWFSLDYASILKVRMISYLWLSFFILLLAMNFSGYVRRSKYFYSYFTILILYTIFVVIAPTEPIFHTRDMGLFTILYFLPLVWFVYLIGKMVMDNQTDAVFLLFAAASIASSAIWGAFTFKGIVETIYYPIDIIAALVAFSAYWFKRYFRNSEENAKLNEQFRQTDKLKDQFLANTSHELRTPLHGIMNIAQSVREKEKDSLSINSSENMDLLITISRRMSYMLDDLLDVIRLQDKRIVLEKIPLRIESIASGVVSMLKFMTEGKPVQLQINIEEALPPVLGDEKRLVQILFNLLHNSIKYTEEGIISVSAKLKNKQIIIQVSDSGVGMDRETQERIFKPYEQGPHGITDGGGIGLGLSICQQLVELHGSKLTVVSEPNKGSIFSFSLPVASFEGLLPLQDENQKQPILSQEALNRLTLSEAVSHGTVIAHSAPVFNEGKFNILVVDDDNVNLKVLLSILSEEQFNIVPTTSAREALEVLSTKQWDLLIVDVMMPHMSGYELTQRVRENFSISELPILLLTARSQPADIYTGFSSGANDYVTKPVDAMELKYRIWSLTTLKHSINERLRMEAAYLQAQIQPHFLFNTLNSIMALSDIDPDKMRKLGDAFSSYLRISFDFLNSAELVTLEHELELVRAYLYIEQERFPNRLIVNWDIDPTVKVSLPPLTIQPLVENAVSHGVLAKTRGGTVSIRITRQDTFTLIEVLDDGKGMDQNKVQQLLDPSFSEMKGIGVANTNRRLIQMYGNGLSIQSSPDKGTRVSFVIPNC